mmetsp:Transcript_16136/g.27593  ORF Transcript_16136/g.27593 Transcript_16136/m.27593 type:complete len:331 (-) Transcript_16136:405-1397(-)
MFAVGLGAVLRERRLDTNALFVALETGVARQAAWVARATGLGVQAHVAHALVVAAREAVVARVVCVAAARARDSALVQIAARHWRSGGGRVSRVGRRCSGGRCCSGGGGWRGGGRGDGTVALAQATTVVVGVALGTARRRSVRDLGRVARRLVRVVAETVVRRGGADVVARQQVRRLADDKRRHLRVDGFSGGEASSAGRVARAAEFGAHIGARLAHLAAEHVLFGRSAGFRRQLQVVRVPERTAIGTALFDEREERQLAFLVGRHFEAPRGQVRFHFGRRVHNRARARRMKHINTINHFPISNFLSRFILCVQQKTAVLTLEFFHTNRN